ncbi:MAG: hypothetical protein QXL96_02705 [Ignisphaera sp.]
MSEKPKTAKTIKNPSQRARATTTDLLPTLKDRLSGCNYTTYTISIDYSDFKAYEFSIL